MSIPLSLHLSYRARLFTVMVSQPYDLQFPYMPFSANLQNMVENPIYKSGFFMVLTDRKK